MDPRVLVTYARPPVAEVVCGVQFPPPTGLKTAHLGNFWNELEGFPAVDDAPPLMPVIETPQGSMQLEQDVFFAPRFLFRNSDGTELVQVQRDRFLCNWRQVESEWHQVESERSYPRYSAIIDSFFAHFERFESFIRSKLGVGIDAQQYELTYVNHIPFGELCNSLGEIGRIFRDTAWNPSPRDILSIPNAIDHRTIFLLPDGSGRLHVQLQSAAYVKDATPLLKLQLTARGFSTDRVAWFNLAHKWIVLGFGDLTTAEAQKTLWGKKDA